MFLTENEVVKYYEKGDNIYIFDVDLSDPHDIQLDISRFISFESEPEKLSNTVITNSFKEFGSSEILNIMELTLIEKKYIRATTKSVDADNGLLYVTSSDESTLESVKVKNNIYDLKGNLVNVSNVVEGDVLKVYYYNRYSSYEPVNILVDDVIVEKVIYND